jgi:hypothetical protein
MVDVTSILVLNQERSKCTTGAGCELFSKLDPTGGFGAFHSSWFAFSIHVSSIADESTKMQSIEALHLGWFGAARRLQYFCRLVIEVAHVARPSTFQPDSPATEWRHIVSPG